MRNVSEEGITYFIPTSGNQLKRRQKKKETMKRE